TCSQEPTLKPASRTAPIRLLLYNTSGADIRVSALDFEGKRSRYVVIGDDRSAPILTYVSHPLGGRRYLGAMPSDHHAGTKHTLRHHHFRRACAGWPVGAAAREPHAGQRAGIASIYRCAWSRRAELRGHDAGSGGS